MVDFASIFICIQHYQVFHYSVNIFYLSPYSHYKAYILSPFLPFQDEEFC
jgi:hypothetical protein